MKNLTLRIAEQGTELPLTEGVHAVARDARGVYVGPDGRDALLRVCVDRRGVWLTVPAGASSVHVNGRRVRRMAMLRVGDAIFIDEGELVLARAPVATDIHHAPAADAVEGDPRVVLRGVGGKHHGRSFTLDRPRLVGSAETADIRIGDPAFAERHAQIRVQGDRITLRDLGSAEGSILNGHVVRDAFLEPGDQLVFDAHHRFVVEAPGKSLGAEMPASAFAHAGDAQDQAHGNDANWRRWPWLLLAALLIAAGLSALLMFGSAR